MADSRRCSACRRELPAESFGFKVASRGVRHSKCRDCTREYSRRHYEANKQAYIGRAKRSNAAVIARKREVVAELRSRPCADCGRTFPPCCMQFDHRDGRTVTGRNSPEAIANVKNDHNGVGVLAAEVAKCDVVCANCHTIRTHARRASEACVTTDSSS